MMIAETYDFLSQITAYPENKETLQAGIEAVVSFLEEQDIPGTLAPFAEFVAHSTLAALQEDYVATFDFSPTVALYIGHHIHGDNQKKGAYLIKVKQEFRRYGFTPPGNELPDHLPLLLQFLAHLARHEEAGVRKRFISDCILPGMERLTAGFNSRKNSPWKPLMETARVFCSTDATVNKEVKPC